MLVLVALGVTWILDGIEVTIVGAIGPVLQNQQTATPALKELWAKVANESLERTGDEGQAIREANAVVARQAEGS